HDRIGQSRRLYRLYRDRIRGLPAPGGRRHPGHPCPAAAPDRLIIDPFDQVGSPDENPAPRRNPAADVTSGVSSSLLSPMKSLFPVLAFLMLLVTAGTAQAQATYDTTIVHRVGRVMTIRIRGNDTLVLVVNPEVVVKARPVFANDEEYRQ